MLLASVILGGNSHNLPEYSGKIVGAAEAGLQGDSFNPQIFLQEQVAGRLDPILNQILDGGDMKIVLEELGQVGGREAADFGQLLQSKRILIIRVDSIQAGLQAVAGVAYPGKSAQGSAQMHDKGIGIGRCRKEILNFFFTGQLIKLFPVVHYGGGFRQSKDISVFADQISEEIMSGGVQGQKFQFPVAAAFGQIIAGIAGRFDEKGLPGFQSVGAGVDGYGALSGDGILKDKLLLLGIQMINDIFLRMLPVFPADRTEGIIVIIRVEIFKVIFISFSCLSSLHGSNPFQLSESVYIVLKSSADIIA